MIDRQSVRDNAKYLQSVRPIDPEEICEYIDGQPHPAVVKQTLREEAFDLGLVERDDGTFVPIDEGPVDYRQWTPEAFPEPYSFALEDQLVERYGANWHRGESGETLRERITGLKEDYFAGADVEYDETAALGYAIYHLPDYYAAVGYVLETLAERGLLDRTLRVLDVGAGSGGPALGLHDYLFKNGEDGDDPAVDPEAALVDYHAVEPSASADVLEAMLGETSLNFRSTIHRSTIEAYLADGERDEDGADEFDLICFGNVLSELDDPVAVVDASLDLLADDGTVLALEPADLETATGLREIERAIAPPESDVTIYAPTLRLWDGKAPDDRGWSFDVRDDIDVPPFQRRLEEGQSADDGDPDQDAFINVDVQFAYSLLRTDGEREDDGADEFDLICFGNVLSELDDPVAVVDASLDLLADDGTVLALEPADLETATGLREIERAVAPPESDVTIYAPTLRLWDGKAPDDRGWSFDVRDDIDVPPFQRRLEEGQSADDGDPDQDAFINVDVQFAYSLLRTDGERRYPFRASRKRHAPLSTMEDHVTERINLLAVKLSHNLSDGGNPLFLVGDGSQQVDHYAVLTNESGLNRDLQSAPYGAVLEFENVLALWNDDEEAYNLVVDAETVVDAVSGY